MKLRINDRVKTNRVLDGVPCGTGATVVAFSDNGDVRVVFDHSSIGRGFVAHVSEDDLSEDEVSFNDDVLLEKFFEKEFMKSRPRIPARINIDLDEEERTTYDLVDVVDGERIEYREEAEGVSYLVVEYSINDLYQFGRLISRRKFHGISFD